MEEDLQDPRKEKEIKSEGEKEQGQRPHTGTTIASIGVVKPTKIRRTERMSTGGKPPRHCLAPRTPSPNTKTTFHTFSCMVMGEGMERKTPRGKNGKRITKVGSTD